MKSKLQLRREKFDLNVQEVSELSDISTTAIYRIERGDRTYKTNISVATALADALDCEVDELFAMDELSWNVGRPPHTGKPIGTVYRGHIAEMLCPDCFVLVPADIGCTNCGQPAHSVV